MNSDEDTSLAQLVRTPRGRQGAGDSGSGDSGRGLGHHWSPKLSLRTAVSPGADASNSHDCHCSGSLLRVPVLLQNSISYWDMWGPMARASLNTLLVTLLVKIQDHLQERIVFVPQTSHFFQKSGCCGAL